MIPLRPNYRFTLNDKWKFFNLERARAEYNKYKKALANTKRNVTRSEKLDKQASELAKQSSQNYKSEFQNYEKSQQNLNKSDELSNLTQQILGNWKGAALGAFALNYFFNRNSSKGSNNSFTGGYGGSVRFPSSGNGQQTEEWNALKGNPDRQQYIQSVDYHIKRAVLAALSGKEVTNIGPVKAGEVKPEDALSIAKSKTLLQRLKTKEYPR